MTIDPDRLTALAWQVLIVVVVAYGLTAWLSYRAGHRLGYALAIAEGAAPVQQ